jgi:hypothetical protein
MLPAFRVNSHSGSEFMERIAASCRGRDTVSTRWRNDFLVGAGASMPSMITTRAPSSGIAPRLRDPSAAHVVRSAPLLQRVATTRSCGRASAALRGARSALKHAGPLDALCCGGDVRAAPAVSSLTRPVGERDAATPARCAGNAYRDCAARAGLVRVRHTAPDGRLP